MPTEPRAPSPHRRPVVRPRSGDHRHDHARPRRPSDDELALPRQCWRFTRRAARDEAVDTLRDLKIDESFERGHVDAISVVERCQSAVNAPRGPNVSLVIYRSPASHGGIVSPDMSDSTVSRSRTTCHRSSSRAPRGRSCSSTTSKPVRTRACDRDELAFAKFARRGLREHVGCSHTGPTTSTAKEGRIIAYDGQDLVMRTVKRGPDGVHTASITTRSLASSSRTRHARAAPRISDDHATWFDDAPAATALDDCGAEDVGMRRFDSVLY